MPECKHRTTYIEYTYAGNFTVCIDCLQVIRTYEPDDLEVLE